MRATFSGVQHLDGKNFAALAALERTLVGVYCPVELKKISQRFRSARPLAGSAIVSRAGAAGIKTTPGPRFSSFRK